MAVLFCGLAVLAHGARLAPLTELYVLRAWEEDQGLPFRAIAAVGQSADGYLWIGTYAEVARFDGVRYESRPPHDFHPELGDSGLAFLPDGKNAMWVGTANGLGRWSPTDVKPYARNEGLPLGDVRSLARDPEGRLLATIDRKLFALGGNRFAEVPLPGPAPDNALLAINDRDGGVWVRSSTRLWHQSKGGGWQVETMGDGSDAMPIRGFAPARAGGIWLAMADTVRRREPGNWREGWNRPEGFRGDEVAMTEDKRGNVWLGCYLRGIVVRRPDGSFHQCTAQEGLQNNSVTAIFEDREGDVWAATNGGGIHQFRWRSFTTYDESHGATQSTFNALVEVSPGRFAVATHGGGLVWFENGKFSEPIALSPKPDENRHWVLALALDHSGDVWAGTYGGRLFQITASSTNEIAGLPGNTRAIHALFEDSRHRLWIGSDLGLAVREAGVLRVLGPNHGIPGAFDVRSIAEDRQGRIWVTGSPGGPLRMNPAGVFENVPMPRVSHSFSAGPMFRDHLGDLWLGADDQPLLLRFREHGTDVFGAVPTPGKPQNGTSTPNRLPVGTIRCLVEDAAGDLWLGSKAGIARVTRTSIERAATNPAALLESHWFGHLDGLRSLSCRPASSPSAILARDGRVWFATTKGLSVANPASVREPLASPVPWIEELETHDHIHPAPQDPGVEVVVEAGTRHIDARYSAAGLSDPSRMQFAYRLDTTADVWQDGPSARSVALLDLRPGHHRFEVRSRLKHEQYWSEPAVIRFEVLPFWWQRGSVQSAGIFAGLGIVALIGRRRSSAQARREEQRRIQENRVAQLRLEKETAEAASQAKTEFVAMISHELRTPLHGLIGFNELLSGTLLNRQQSDYVHTTRVSAEALLNVINDVLDFARLESGHFRFETEDFEIRPMLGAALELVVPRAAAKNLDLFLVVAPGVPPMVHLDAHRIQQVVLNLVANAVKFTESGSVVVRVGFAPDKETPNQGELLCEVIDTGIGIGASERTRLFHKFAGADSPATRRTGGAGLGLVISRQLVERMSGVIECESTPDQGSRFWFRVPTAIPHPSVAVQSRLPVVSVLAIGLDSTHRSVVEGWLGRELEPGETAADAGEGLVKLRDSAASATTPSMLIASRASLGPVPAATPRSWRRSVPGSPVQFVLMLSLRESADATAAGSWGFDRVWQAPFGRLPTPVPECQPPGYVGNATAYPPAKVPVSPSGVSSTPTRRAGSRPQLALLAEDHPVNREYAAEILRSSGFEVHIAASGREAVALAEKHRYDIVLMDCQMPDIDGLEATRLIRRNEPPGRRVRIVALTAGAVEGDRDLCFAAGMDAYVSKPFRIADLRRELESNGQGSVRR